MTESSRLRIRSLRVEAQLALATPVSRWLLVGSVLMSATFCIANLVAYDDLADDSAVQVAMHSATVPVLIFSLVAGGYAASADRRFGFLEQRLLSDQNRVRWLAGKASVQAGLGLLYGLLGVATAIGASSLAYAFRDADFDVGNPEVAAALVGVALAAPLLSVIGVFVGSLVPNTPLVVAGILVWSLVLEPPIFLGLPSVGRWLPTSSALALTNGPDPDFVSQATGGLALAVYAVLVFMFVQRRLRNIDV